MDQSGNIIYHPQQQLIYSDLKRENTSLIAGLPDGSNESGSMIFGTVTENVGQQMENTEDIQVILADRQEVLRILREERVSMRCGLMLMQFLKTGAEDPFVFLQL